MTFNLGKFHLSNLSTTKGVPKLVINNICIKRNQLNSQSGIYNLPPIKFRNNPPQEDINSISKIVNKNESFILKKDKQRKKSILRNLSFLSTQILSHEKIKGLHSKITQKVDFNVYNVKNSFKYPKKTNFQEFMSRNIPKINKSVSVETFTNNKIKKMHKNFKRTIIESIIDIRNLKKEMREVLKNYQSLFDSKDFEPIV